MASTVLVSLAAVALPTIVFIFGGWIMMEVSGRNAVIAEAKCRQVDLEAMSLSMKPKGYDAGLVRTYWDALQPKGQKTELHFLKIDVLFALLYSAAFAFSILALWTAMGGRVGTLLILLMAPVFITLAADWIEGYLQISQLKNYMADGALESARIAAASRATIVKIWAFVLSSLIVLVLAIALPIVGNRSGPDVSVSTGSQQSSN